LSPLLLILAGLVALVAGAELLVAGASRIARGVGVTPLVIGLTVVAFGTSAPELAVSSVAALRGDSEIALGNVVGSNIFNVLFILGVSALARPLLVSPTFVRRDVPIMIAASLVLWALAADGGIGRIEGLILAAGIVAYTAMQIRSGRSSGESMDVAAGGEGAGSVLRSILVALAGLALLVFGSGWLVEGARDMAASMGVPNLVIGLTLVAAGTSLPELATSVVATFRGQREIAIGNIIGSNVFNLLAILGISSMLGPDGIEVPAEALRFDLPIMVLVAVVCVPIFLTGSTVSRVEGVGLVVAYVVYVIALGLKTTGPLGGVGPALVATGLALAVWTALAWRRLLAAEA
jgi:cation:H+ antiporter